MGYLAYSQKFFITFEFEDLHEAWMSASENTTDSICYRFS